MRIAIAFVSLLLMGQSQTSFAAERGSWHLDLSQFGYTALPPKPAPLSVESVQSPHLVDFDEKGNVVVGILERAQKLQSRSANETATLQILIIGPDGKVLRTLATPASSIYENVVWAAPAGNLFIRTGDDVKLVSREGATVVSRHLVSHVGPYQRFLVLFAAPNRNVFGISEANGEYIILAGRDLRPMAGPCRSGKGHPDSVTERYVVLESEPAIRSLYGRRIEVRDFCGDVVWSHEWDGRPASAKLLAADRVLLLGTEAHIELISRERSEWKLSWGKHKDLPQGYARTSVDGSVIGVLLRHFAGGSRIFDIPEKLVGATLVLLEGQSGRIIAKLPIRFPAQTFDFAISRDGRAVATLTEGDLMVTEISKPSEKQ